MNIKKLSLLSFLLFASAVPISAMTTNSSTENGTKKQEEQITWREWLKKHPFAKDTILFTLGALYTGSRVLLDHSEPTLNGFLKSSGKRALWQTVGALALPIALFPIIKPPSEKQPTVEFIMELVNEPVIWNSIIAHAAYREMYKGRIIGPVLSIIDGFTQPLVGGCLETYYDKNSSIPFYNGQLFGSLLGVGLRYRHDLGAGLKQTPGLVRQIPALIHSAIKYLPFKNRPLIAAIG